MLAECMNGRPFNLFMDTPASVCFFISISTQELSNWLRPLICTVLILTVTMSLGELGMTVIPDGFLRFQRDKSNEKLYAPTPLSCRKKTRNDLWYALEYITFVVHYRRKHSSALPGPLQSLMQQRHSHGTSAHILLEMLPDQGRTGSSPS